MSLPLSFICIFNKSSSIWTLCQHRFSWHLPSTVPVELAPAGIFSGGKRGPPMEDLKGSRRVGSSGGGAPELGRRRSYQRIVKNQRKFYNTVFWKFSKNFRNFSNGLKFYRIVGENLEENLEKSINLHFKGVRGHSHPTLANLLKSE